MKEIKLTRGLVTQVDDEDYEYLNQFKWYAEYKKGGKYTYAIRNSSDRTTEAMHRIIMGTPAGLLVDHIDHNGLNNQKSNLRNCTHDQNGINRTGWGRSKYLGVALSKRGYIIAQITYNHNHNYLGCFKTEEEAARAYDIKAKEFFGEFANLNFKNE
jgi:hypothetical protein